MLLEDDYPFNWFRCWFELLWGSFLKHSIMMFCLTAIDIEDIVPPPYLESIEWGLAPYERAWDAFTLCESEWLKWPTEDSSSHLELSGISDELSNSSMSLSKDLMFDENCWSKIKLCPLIILGDRYPSF